ncbi:MAG: 4-hydroxy-tetrahydrodipicolinate synthase [Calditrichaceae bacterium]
MKALKDLKGCGTALVTPFKYDGQIDFDALRKLVDYQIRGGIDFLVPCGTTGESATFTLEEHLQVVETVVKQAAGKVPVIAGAGGNNTAKVIEMAKEVAKLGVDGLLSVTPYYNKPTQEGLYQHYKAIASAVSSPIIVYNVPGRTSTNILPDTAVRLSGIDNIIGIKEASGNIGQIAELAAKIPENFKILSGDDATTIPIISLGGVGLISVVSNQVPGKMTKMTNLCLKGDYSGAREIQKELFNLMTLNFIETNPTPVKAGLAMMGMMDEIYRLPLVKMNESNKKLLENELRKLNVI